MAELLSTFDKLSSGAVTFSGTEAWFDITSYLPDQNSPIPVGKRIWVGFVTCISYDKNATFELRPNLPTKSLGSIAETQLRGFASVPAGDSKDMDMHYGGAILTLAPVSVASTGVEKLWLRVKSGSNSAASYEFIMYYSLY